MVDVFGETRFGDLVRKWIDDPNGHYPQNTGNQAQNDNDDPGWHWELGSGAATRIHNSHPKCRRQRLPRPAARGRRPSFPPSSPRPNTLYVLSGQDAL